MVRQKQKQVNTQIVHIHTPKPTKPRRKRTKKPIKQTYVSPVFYAQSHFPQTRPQTLYETAYPKEKFHEQLSSMVRQEVEKQRSHLSAPIKQQSLSQIESVPNMRTIVNTEPEPNLRVGDAHISELVDEQFNIQDAEEEEIPLEVEDEEKMPLQGPEIPEIKTSNGMIDGQDDASALTEASPRNSTPSTPPQPLFGTFGPSASDMSVLPLRKHSEPTPTTPNSFVSENKAPEQLGRSLLFGQGPLSASSLSGLPPLTFGSNLTAVSHESLGPIVSTSNTLANATSNAIKTPKEKKEKKKVVNPLATPINSGGLSALVQTDAPTTAEPKNVGGLEAGDTKQSKKKLGRPGRVPVDQGNKITNLFPTETNMNLEPIDSSNKFDFPEAKVRSFEPHSSILVHDASAWKNAEGPLFQHNIGSEM